MSAGRKMNVPIIGQPRDIFEMCRQIKSFVYSLGPVSMTMPHDFQQSRLSEQICIQTVAMLKGQSQLSISLELR